MSVTPNTKLSAGITVGNFLRRSGHGEKSFSDLTDSEKNTISANLTQHVQMIEAINGKFKKFPNHRLAIAEGIYFPGVGESTSGYNTTKQTGATVVYQMIDRNGNVDSAAAYDLAAYWKDYFTFKEVALSYDTINPDGSLTGSVIVTIGTGNSINTYFNNVLTFSNELVEITA